jgi:hypothetical protein
VLDGGNGIKGSSLSGFLLEPDSVNVIHCPASHGTENSLYMWAFLLSPGSANDGIAPPAERGDCRQFRITFLSSPGQTERCWDSLQAQNGRVIVQDACRLMFAVVQLYHKVLLVGAEV